MDIRSPANTMNLTTIISESKRIIRANFTHFITLSLLFLPLSLYLITSDHFNKFTPNHTKPVIYHNLFYILVAYLLALCATATITYTTYNSFFSKPITLFTTLKSLTIYFFPLVWTAVLSHLFLCLISISYLMFFGVILILVQRVGFVIDYNSSYLMFFTAVLSVTLFVIIIYFHVIWSLAYVVVVAESKCGFEPLMRSSDLLKGMRLVSLKLLLFYGIIGGFLVFVYSRNLLNYGLSRTWSVINTLFGSGFLMILFLQSSVVNIVLYNHCKTLNDELAIGIDEGFTFDYVNLPDNDDEKVVPCSITVVTT